MARAVAAKGELGEEGKLFPWFAWCAMARAVAAKGELGEEGKLFPWFAWCSLVYI